MLFSCAWLAGALIFQPTQDAYPIAPGVSVHINLSPNAYSRIFFFEKNQPMLTIEQAGAEAITVNVDETITSLEAFFDTCEARADAKKEAAITDAIEEEERANGDQENEPEERRQDQERDTAIDE